MIANAAGNGTRDFTLGSHGCDSNALTKASPVNDLFAIFSTQRAAATTSKGNVEAINI
jgi:hypothetical protein